ncbi:MAG: nitrous oxide reductase [Segetibacter sp.]|nr:nitrous oxide reductase [Segetibacter sp.]
MKYFLVILLLTLQITALSNTIEVGTGKKHATIKSAIEAAKDGDVILIHRATYAEGEITINKQLHLKGINWPVIDGKQKSQILYVLSDNVIIEGLDIRNCGYSSSYDWAAIKVLDCKKVIILNNRLFNNSFAINLQNTSFCRIENNYVKGNPINGVESGNAIHCWKSNNVRILNNEVTGHRDGIYFEFVTHSFISNNKSYKNIRYGLHFMFSNDDTYYKNTFSANGSGVAVMFSKRVSMLWNRFEENWGSAAYGILMKEISDGKVEHNTFTRNTVGIFMEGTSRIYTSKNVFTSNGWAMRVQASCEDNTITGNNYFGNTFDVGTNGTMQLNKFYSNYWDKYEGYDLNKDGYGDVHYQPVSLYSMIVEKIPAASLLLRSFLVTIMDKAERVIPSITPVELKDDKPLMKPLQL